MDSLTFRELEIEVAALRKQNYDLTEALLTFFKNGGLHFNAVWSRTEHEASSFALDDIKVRAMVDAAVARVRSELGSRGLIHKQNSILRHYAAAYIHDSSVRCRLEEDLYGDQRSGG